MVQISTPGFSKSWGCVVGESCGTGRDGDGCLEAGEALAVRWMAKHWDAMVDMANKWAGACAITPEDIAQEALWAAYERRDRLVDPTGERAWLLAFVRNKAREAVKRNVRCGERLPGEYVDTYSDGDPVTNEDSRQERVLEVASRLPCKQKEIVRLLLKGRSDDEIASALHLKKGTLWVYKHRAIQKLKEMLGDEALRGP